jgi:O-methyltransferase
MQITRALASTLNRLLRSAGVELRRIEAAAAPDRFWDIEPWVAEIVGKVEPFTMTSPERISALCHAVRYIARAGIPGDIVECGVWRGGSMMAAALTLLAEGEERTLWLYDTFQGMPPPTAIDRAAKYHGKPAKLILAESDQSSNYWAISQIDEVRANLESTRYPPHLIKYIAGKVEDTIPHETPKQIALLRLDTDWYESTKWELVQLYPLLAIGGILILDDYGFWEGARKATDEYIFDSRAALLLHRIDGGGRIAIKTGLPLQGTSAIKTAPRIGDT